MLGMYSGACASSLVGGVRLLCTERRFDPASTAPAGVVLGSVARLDASSRGNPCSCSVREQTTAAPPGVAYLVGGVVLELLHCSLPRCAGEVRAKALRRPRLWAWLPFLKALQGSLLFALDLIGVLSVLLLGLSGSEAKSLAVLPYGALGVLVGCASLANIRWGW